MTVSHVDGNTIAESRLEKALEVLSQLEQELMNDRRT